jgi:hypothetical protein
MIQTGHALILYLKSAKTELALIGVPASATALSPTSAHLTPAAIRGALGEVFNFCWIN